MLNWITAFFMAWGMFLAIPCPVKKWDEGSRRRMLVMFPLIGAIVGALLFLALYLVRLIHCPPVAAAFVAACLPYFLTGFIHLDGFADVSDALLSRRSLAEKQRILKDPHIGAFGVISLIFVILAQFSVFLTLFSAAVDPLPLSVPVSLALVPVASRAAAGLAVLTFKPMKTSSYAGMDGAEELKAESAVEIGEASAENAEKELDRIKKGKKLPRRLSKQSRMYAVALSAMLFAAAALPFALYLHRGLAPVAAAAVYFIAALPAKKSLGGMNGDISGFALTLAEVVGFAVMVLVR